MGNVTELYRDSVFHVHTRRCKHAEDLDFDEDYVVKAISMGAKAIFFTDHVPFKNNPFPNRMDYEELPEYIDSILLLKEKYAGKIDIKLGLEIEYLPSFLDYYKELKADERLEWLIVGQHFYEHDDGTFSLKDSKEYKMQHESYGQMKAMTEACKSGLFKVIAHPDRAFRGRTEWTDEMYSLSEELIRAAIENDVILEKNFTSMLFKHYYHPKFWELAEKISEEYDTPLKIVYGSDAHSIFEMKLGL